MSDRPQDLTQQSPQQLASKLRDLWDKKTKPQGSLGRLEEVGMRLGSLQQT